MKSATGLWANAPWNPVAELAPRYQVISMDQRNAGRSTAPVHNGDGWHTYTADQLALLDHLGIDRCHTFGMCIGGSYCLGLAHEAPDRITAAVLLQPIGLDDNREAFYQMFDGWAEELRGGSHPTVPDSVWQAMRGRMYDGDFLFNLSRAQVAGLATPILVLRGNDLYHPASASEAIAELAANASLVRDWKTPEHLAAGRQAVLDFLAAHTP
jgi:pimeloyl-ACP methyl ester carboxylesterase